MFGSLKKLWDESGITASVDGVLREAARGNASEVQRWYFKLKKHAYKQSLQDGLSPAEIERRALSSIEPAKARQYSEVVQRLSQPGGVLHEVNEWLKHNPAAH